MAKTATPKTESNAAIDPLITAAIAGAISSKDQTAAKKALPERSIKPVDVTLRIRGTVAKGADTPASQWESPAVVNMADLGLFSEVLAELKATPTKLRNAIRRATKTVEAPADVAQLGRGEAAQELRTLIEAEADKLAAGLPPQPGHRSGRAGSVTAEVSIELLDTPKYQAA
jgi:hypothetical protein